MPDSSSYSPKDIIKVLKSFQFNFSVKFGNSEVYIGIYKNIKRKVIVDTTVSLYSKDGLVSLISQTGIPQKKFNKSLNCNKPEKKHGPSKKNHRPKEKKKKSGFNPGKGSRKKYKA